MVLKTRRSSWRPVPPAARAAEFHPGVHGDRVRAREAYMVTRPARNREKAVRFGPWALRRSVGEHAGLITRRKPVQLWPPLPPFMLRERSTRPVPGNRDRASRSRGSSCGMRERKSARLLSEKPLVRIQLPQQRACGNWMPASLLISSLPVRLRPRALLSSWWKWMTTLASEARGCRFESGRGGTGPHRLLARSAPSQGAEAGSIPAGVTMPTPMTVRLG